MKAKRTQAQVGKSGDEKGTKGSSSCGADDDDSLDDDDADGGFNLKAGSGSETGQDVDLKSCHLSPGGETDSQSSRSEVPDISQDQKPQDPLPSIRRDSCCAPRINGPTTIPSQLPIPTGVTQSSLGLKHASSRLSPEIDQKPQLTASLSLRASNSQTMVARTVGHPPHVPPAGIESTHHSSYPNTISDHLSSTYGTNQNSSYNGPASYGPNVQTSFQSHQNYCDSMSAINYNNSSDTSSYDHQSSSSCYIENYDYTQQQSATTEQSGYPVQDAASHPQQQYSTYCDDSSYYPPSYGQSFSQYPNYEYPDSCCKQQSAVATHNTVQSAYHGYHASSQTGYCQYYQ